MKLIPLFILALVLLSACGGGPAQPQRYTAFDGIKDHSKPVALGENEDIYVFCGLENRARLEPLVKASLEREVALVYNEKYFNVIFSDIKDIDGISRYRNLLLLGSLEGGDPVSRHIKQSLSADLQNRVRQSGGDIFISKNRFTRDQLIVHLVGLDDTRLRDLADSQANRLFSTFLERYTQRLAHQAYLGKIIPAGFFEPYPFSLKVPDTFRLYSNDKNNRFLSLLYRARMENREIPDKFVSVYYEDMESDRVDETWLTDQRKRIGKLHFEGDSLNVQTLRTERFKFAGYEGFRLSGAWINPARMAGGAFQSYGFWDPKTKKAWLVDTMVFFPAGDKLPSLMELFMIASTFKAK